MSASFTPEEVDKAVALFYDGQRAPHVSASGRGDVAREIMAIAKTEGVPLHDNSDLVELLITLELGDEIPESLYLAVAHVIAFAYELQGKTPGDSGNPHSSGKTRTEWGPTDQDRSH